MPKTLLKSKPVAKKKAVTAPKQAVPEGYSGINSYLTVKDPAAATAWYQKAFGFTKKFAMEDGGKVVHAEMTYEGSTFMMGPECTEQKSYGPAHYKGCPVTFYVYTADVDKLTTQAKKAGAKVVREPKDQDWGDRTSIVTDPDGYSWMLATRMAGGCCSEPSSCSN